jgi:hypothetical protein
MSKFTDTDVSHWIFSTPPPPRERSPVVASIEIGADAYRLRTSGAWTGPDVGTVNLLNALHPPVQQPAEVAAAAADRFAGRVLWVRPAGEAVSSQPSAVSQNGIADS